MGRPVRYGGEKGGVEERARYMAAIAEEALAPLVPKEKTGFRRYVKREPLGLVIVIAPWNYPYLTAVNTIFPALMAGNAVLLKHAAQTLLVGERFQAAADKAGLPKGLFQNLVLGHEQTEKLIGSGKVDHVNFTGSVEGGKADRARRGRHLRLARAGARRQGPGLCACPTRSSTTPSRISSTAPSTIPASAAAASSASMSTRRSIDAFRRGLRRLTKKYVVGNPLDQATTLGPMARASSPISSASRSPRRMRKGATPHVNMKVEGDRPGSPYLAPEVLTTSTTRWR